jgi:uncharacterized protein (DUF697 family)
MAKSETQTITDPTHMLKNPDVEAEDQIKYYARCAAAAGVIPAPIVDVAAVTAVQVRMVKRLAAAYGADYDESSGRALVSSLVGSYLPARIGYGSVGMFIRMTPIIGGVLGLITVPGFNYASTWAVGRVFKNHFAKGGTLPTLDMASAKRQYREVFGSAPSTQPA